MKKDYYKKEFDNERFLTFITMLSDSDMQEMSLSDIWEITKILYYYSHPDYSHQIINMGAMKRDIKMARDHQYLTISGNRSTTKYVRTDLLK